MQNLTTSWMVLIYIYLSNERNIMKKLLFFIVLPLFISCKSVQTTTTYKPILDSLNNVVTVDTIQVVSMGSSRQERLIIRDSLKHVEAIAKLENARLKDSLKMLLKDNRNLRRNKNKGAVISRKADRDSLNYLSKIAKYEKQIEKMEFDYKKQLEKEKTKVAKLDKQVKMSEERTKRQKGRKYVFWIIFFVAGFLSRYVVKIVKILV